VAAGAKPGYFNAKHLHNCRNGVRAFGADDCWLLWFAGIADFDRGIYESPVIYRYRAVLVGRCEALSAHAKRLRAFA
jgi:hypothetical protein